MQNIIPLFKEKNTITFIFIALLFINSGFYLQFCPPVSPLYIFFYIAFPFVSLYLATSKKFKINIPVIIGFILVYYILGTQFILQGRPVAILGSAATFMFYIIGVIFIPKLTVRQNFFIANTILIYYVLIYGFDTLYRLSLFGFNIKNLLVGTSFYAMKVECLLYGDTNPLAIATTTLLFFASYLYSITKNKWYLLFAFLYGIITFLTFSRSAIIAVILAMIILSIFFIAKIILKKSKKSLSPYILSFNKLIAYLLTIVAIFLSLGIVSKIITYLLTDGSFASKLDLMNDVVVFFKNAPINEIFLGIGFNNGRIAEYSELGYAHAYLTTYICETGIIGYLLVTSFLISIILETHKTVLLIFMFFIMGISYIGHAQLHLFYSILAFVWYFEKFNIKNQGGYQCH